MPNMIMARRRLDPRKVVAARRELHYFGSGLGGPPGIPGGTFTMSDFNGTQIPPGTGQDSEALP
jgi:hypothetical protein